MQSATRRIIVVLAGLTLCGLVGCQTARDRTVMLTLTDAVQTHKGESRDVTLHMVRRGGQWVASFATARHWNAATHAVTPTQLQWDADANELQGRVSVTLLPDAWIPRDQKPRSLDVQIDAAADGNAMVGRYNGVFEGREVAGTLVGRILPAQAPTTGDRAGLLRVFLPAPKGKLRETVMRFSEQEGRVAHLGGATSLARELDIDIDSDGLAGECDLSFGDEDGPYGKPTRATFDLSFIDGRIGGVVYLMGQDGNAVAKPYSISGWLEREADCHLANQAEPVRPHADTRLLDIAEAQEETKGLEEKFTAHVYRLGGVEQPYRLFSPKVPDGGKLPLVVYLHGAGARGSDNKRQLNSWGKTFARAKWQKQHPCFVLVPHASNWYGGAPKGASDDSPSHADLILQIVRTLRSDPRIDRQRIYVTGLSMGGFGTCELISRAPTMFAAGVPICGAIAEQADALADTPMWIFHGDSDVTVHVSHSRDLVKAMRAEGADPRYTEYPGVGHGSYKWAYTWADMFEWMFAQKRTKPD